MYGKVRNVDLKKGEIAIFPFKPEIDSFDNETFLFYFLEETLQNNGQFISAERWVIGKKGNSRLRNGDIVIFFYNKHHNGRKVLKLIKRMEYKNIPVGMLELKDVQEYLKSRKIPLTVPVCNSHTRPRRSMSPNYDEIKQRSPCTVTEIGFFTLCDNEFNVLKDYRGMFPNSERKASSIMRSWEKYRRA